MEKLVKIDKEEGEEESKMAVKRIVWNAGCRFRRYTALYPEGAKKFADWLRMNRTLVDLEIENHAIGDIGAIAIVDAVLQSNWCNGCLETLVLCENGIGVEGAKAIAKLLATINTSSNQSKMSSSSLQQLSISKNTIGDEGCKAIAEALTLVKTTSSLTLLNISDNSIGDNGAKSIAEILAANSTLTELDLSSNSIGDEGCVLLAGGLKNSQRSSPFHLHLDRIKIGDKGLAAFNFSSNSSSIPCKLHLHLNGICDVSTPNKDCSKSNLGKVKIIADELISKYPFNQIEGLYLDYNYITDEGVMLIANALLFASNNININTMMMSHKLVGNQLTTLNLADANLGDKGCITIVKYLENKYSSITNLNLNSNHIGAIGGKAIAKMLTLNNPNSPLRELVVGRNQFGDEGLVAISKSLVVNTTLRNINLDSSFGISDVSIKALSSSLAFNSTLQSLSLFLHHDGNLTFDLKSLDHNICLFNQSLISLHSFDQSSALKEKIHHNWISSRNITSNAEIGKLFEYVKSKKSLDYSTLLFLSASFPVKPQISLLQQQSTFALPNLSTLVFDRLSFDSLQLLLNLISMSSSTSNSNNNNQDSDNSRSCFTQLTSLIIHSVTIDD